MTIAPDLPPCGLNNNAARTWVNIYNAKDDSYIYGFCALSSPQDMNSIWFAVAQGASPPEGVYVILTDRRKSITYRSNVLVLKSEIPTTAPTTYTNSIGMEFVQIPVGEFDMGSPPNEAGRDNDEGPVHRVKIANAFYMGKYEVTQKQWREIMGNNPSYFTGENLPVEQVSWSEAQEFVKKLNEKEGTNKYRLPSEAEWEYAARAGTTTKYSFGDDESKLGEYAWYDANSGDKTHEVGQKKPNPWGLYDMYGNVQEWVHDKWHGNYNGAPTDGSAWEGDGYLRVLRGGNLDGYPRRLRSAFRGGDDPSFRYFYLGFRLVREIATTVKQTPKITPTVTSTLTKYGR